MQRSPKELIDEFRSDIVKRIPHVRMTVEAQRNFFERLNARSNNPDHAPLRWILNAHLGTLDKLEPLFESEREYKTYELLAIARNLFENLVWLRLMSGNLQYGLVFYANLLKEQTQHNERTIKKWSDEADLFEEMDKEDHQALASTIGSLPADATPEQVQAAQAAHREAIEELDARVRQEFSIYGEQATHNGYSYQAHLIRTKALPVVRARQEEIAQHQADFDAEAASLLTPVFIKMLKDKWNWFERAKEAGMEKNYRFIYSYTSKLLHSTAMNLITERELAPQEESLVLDFIVVSAKDLLAQIEGFSYPGQARMLFV